MTNNTEKRSLIEDRFAKFEDEHPKPTAKQIDDFMDSIRFSCSDQFFANIKKALYSKHGIK